MATEYSNPIPRKKGTKRVIIMAFILFLASLLTGYSAGARNDKGKAIFEKNCAVCHKLTDEKLVGPGLKGVTERRDKAWLKKFIPGSQELVKAGDKTAVEVFNANSMIPMPDHKFLTDEDLDNLLDYIANYKPGEARKVTVDIAKKDGFSMEDIRRGERLFYGLIPFEKGTTLNCAGCHSLYITDSLNFNPSALDLAQAWQEPNGTNLYQVLNEPASTKMAQVHQGLQMSDKEIYDVSAFLSDVTKKGLKQEKTFPVRLMVFILFAVLMTWALIDLFWLKMVKKRFIHGIILTLGLIVHAGLATQEGIRLSRTKNYAPDQPIKFSHKIHAGQNKTDCLYCHSIASYSKSAGMPSPSLCMNCHKVVTQGTRSGKFEINKISRAIASGKSISWVRIHKLPDHAFFSHAQHVGAGKVQCQECHGHVEEMEIVKQATDLSMGWCVNCHRRTPVQMDNKYYDTFKAFHERLKSGKMGRVTVEDAGGINCAKCHY